MDEDDQKDLSHRENSADAARRLGAPADSLHHLNCTTIRDCKLQVIIDVLPAHMAVLDDRGIIIAVNQPWVRFAAENGLPDTQRICEGADYLAVCRRAADMNSPLAREALEGVEAVLRGQLPTFSLEYPCHSPTQQRWFTMDVRRCDDMAATVVAHLDITDRKRAEDALRRSEANVREAQEIARVGRWELDRVANKLTWSEGIFAMFEVSPEDFGASYEAFMAMVHPDDRAAVDRAYRLHVENKKPYDIEHRLLMKDGRIKWVHEICRTEYDDAGNPIRSVGIVQDITDRKLIDEANQRSAQRMRAIFENAGVGMLEADTEDRFIAANDRACEILGYKRDELLGMTVHELTSPEDRPRSDELNAQLHEGLFPRFDADKRYVRSDGTPLWLHVTVSAVRDSGGRYTGAIATIEDISERKRTEESLQLRVGELAALNALGQAVNASLAMKQTVTAALQGMLNAVGSDLAFLFLREDERLILAEILPPSARQRLGTIPEHRVGECMCGLAVREGRPLYSRDIFKDLRCTWEECKRAGMKSFAALPLRSENQVVGVIGLASTTERDFEGQAGFLETLAGQVSVAVANARLYEEVQRELTERKRAEDALRVSEEQIRHAVRVAGLGTFVHDHDTDKIRWSDEIREMCGWGAQVEGTLSEWVDLIHPDDRDRIKEAIGQAHNPAGDGRYGVEHRVLRKDGSLRWVSVRSQTFFQGEDPARRPFQTIGAMLDITERQQSEEAVRASEARYRGLVELSPDAIFVNRNNRIELVNQAALELFGFASADQMLGKSPLDLFHPDCHEIVRDRIQTVLMGQSVPLIEEKVLRSDGTVRIAEVAASPFVDSQGIAIQVFLRDITERKRAEAQLQQEQVFNEAFLNSMPGMLALYDRRGHLIRWNKQHEKMTGYSSDEIAKMHVLDWFGGREPDTSIIRQETEAVFAKGRTAAEANLVTKDGRLVPCLFTGVMVTVGGEPYVLGMGIDISDRKRAEDALRLNADRIQTLLTLNQMTDASLKEITDFAMEAAVRLTSSTLGYVAFVNEREDVLTMHSWSRAAMAECQIAQKPLVYPLETTGLWGEALRQRKPIVTNDYAADSPLKRGYPEGHVKIARHMNVPIFSGGKAVIVAGVGNKEREYDQTDVLQLTLLMDGLWRLVERKRAEEDLRRTAADLRRSNQDLEQFAYVASHDLQEPLRMVTAYMDLLESTYKGRLDKDADQFIAFAVEGAHRMQQLINDLLTYSRVTARWKEPRRVEVQAAFDRAVADLRGMIAETGTEIAHDPLPEVQGDETQLAQLLMNLFSNAIKFRGDQPPRIRLGASREAGQWVFSVRDNGIGMEPRDFDRIFQVFQRLHTRQKYAGSGIGLAICKRIVDRHGGRIWVESEPGRGSTFYFTIPDRGDV
jgi:two-component system, OmpR family, phosphate regulon sensor histidine kinase PhoR